jgi:hypothetical protein
MAKGLVPEGGAAVPWLGGQYSLALGVSPSSLVATHVCCRLTYDRTMGPVLRRILLCWIV